MTSNQPKIRPSITAHRQFPAFAALWCAALFGLGSIALQPALLESIVAKIGLPALVPAAAPPLGTTARILVALILTIFGFGFGLLIGLRLRTRAKGAVQPQPRDAENGKPRVRSRDAHPDAPPRKPLILSEDLMSELSNDDDDALPLRRRALLADQTPTDPAEWAPLPGDNAMPFEAANDFTGEPASVADATLAEPVGEAQAGAEIDATPAIPPRAEPLFALAAAASPTVTRSPVADAPIQSLGLVQLIERLALAIAERREQREVDGDSAQYTPSSARQAALRSFHAQVDDHTNAAPEALPVDAADLAPFTVPSASATRISAIAAWELGEDDHDIAPFDANGTNTTDEPAQPAHRDHGYSSLLGMKPTASKTSVLRQEFIPVEPDAGYAASLRDMSAQANATDSAETDRALHNALATLRQMTAKG